MRFSPETYQKAMERQVEGLEQANKERRSWEKRRRKFYLIIAEQDRNSPQIWEAKPEYEFVRNLIECFAEAIR